MSRRTIRMTIIGAVALLAAAPTFPQNAELQQKLAAAKQSVAENKQKLLQYQWTETQQLHLREMRSLLPKICASTVLTERSKRPQWVLLRKNRAAAG